MAGVLVKAGGIVTKGGGVFTTGAGTSCCCDTTLYWKRAFPCDCDELPPGAPSSLLISPDGLPNVNPFVFRDSVYNVCWTLDTASPNVEPQPGDEYANTFLQQASCEACCGPAVCPDYDDAPSQVTVTVTWTFNGVFNTESPPPASMTWTMPKTPGPGGAAQYFIAPFTCHPQLPYTEDGCSMRWNAALLCGSPQAPNHWRLSFTFESAKATIIQGTPDKQCDPDYIPPQCNTGVKFYGASGLRPMNSIIGTYQFQNSTPDVSSVTMVVS